MLKIGRGDDFFLTAVIADNAIIGAQKHVGTVFCEAVYQIDVLIVQMELRIFVGNGVVLE